MLTRLRKQAQETTFRCCPQGGAGRSISCVRLLEAASFRAPARARRPQRTLDEYP